MSRTATGKQPVLGADQQQRQKQDEQLKLRFKSAEAREALYKLLRESSEQQPASYDLAKEKAHLRESIEAWHEICKVGALQNQKPEPDKTLAEAAREELKYTLTVSPSFTHSKWAAELFAYAVETFNVDLNHVIDNTKGETLFFYVCRDAPLSVVRLCVEKYGARFDVYDTPLTLKKSGMQLPFDRNPLHWGFSNRDFSYELAPYLLERALAHKRTTKQNLLYDSTGTVSFFLLSLVHGQKLLDYGLTHTVKFKTLRFPSFLTLLHFFGAMRAPAGQFNKGTVVKQATAKEKEAEVRVREEAFEELLRPMIAEDLLQGTKAVLGSGEALSGDGTISAEQQRLLFSMLLQNEVAPPMEGEEFCLHYGSQHQVQMEPSLASSEDAAAAATYYTFEPDTEEGSELWTAIVADVKDGEPVPDRAGVFEEANAQCKKRNANTERSGLLLKRKPSVLEDVFAVYPALSLKFYPPEQFSKSSMHLIAFVNRRLLQKFGVTKKEIFSPVDGGRALLLDRPESSRVRFLQSFRASAENADIGTHHVKFFTDFFGDEWTNHVTESLIKTDRFRGTNKDETPDETRATFKKQHNDLRDTWRKEVKAAATAATTPVIAESKKEEPEPAPEALLLTPRRAGTVPAVHVSRWQHLHWMLRHFPTQDVNFAFVVSAIGSAAFSALHWTSYFGKVAHDPDLFVGYEFRNVKAHVKRYFLDASKRRGGVQSPELALAQARCHKLEFLCHPQKAHLSKIDVLLEEMSVNTRAAVGATPIVSALNSLSRTGIPDDIAAESVVHLLLRGAVPGLVTSRTRDRACLKKLEPDSRNKLTDLIKAELKKIIDIEMPALWKMATGAVSSFYTKTASTASPTTGTATAANNDPDSSLLRQCAEQMRSLLEKKIAVPTSFSGLLGARLGLGQLTKPSPTESEQYLPSLGCLLDIHNFTAPPGSTVPQENSNCGGGTLLHLAVSLLPVLDEKATAQQKSSIQGQHKKGAQLVEWLLKNEDPRCRVDLFRLDHTLSRSALFLAAERGATAVMQVLLDFAATADGRKQFEARARMLPPPVFVPSLTAGGTRPPTPRQDQISPALADDASVVSAKRRKLEAGLSSAATAVAAASSATSRLGPPPATAQSSMLTQPKLFVESQERSATIDAVDGVSLKLGWTSTAKKAGHEGILQKAAAGGAVTVRAGLTAAQLWLVNQVDRSAEPATPLVAACDSKQVGAVRWLLEHGAVKPEQAPPGVGVKPKSPALQQTGTATAASSTVGANNKSKAKAKTKQSAPVVSAASERFAKRQRGEDGQQLTQRQQRNAQQDAVAAEFQQQQEQLRSANSTANKRGRPKVAPSIIQSNPLLNNGTLQLNAAQQQVQVAGTGAPTLHFLPQTSMPQYAAAGASSPPVEEPVYQELWGPDEQVVEREWEVRVVQRPDGETIPDAPDHIKLLMEFFDPNDPDVIIPYGCPEYAAFLNYVSKQGFYIGWPDHTEFDKKLMDEQEKHGRVLGVRWGGKEAEEVLNRYAAAQAGKHKGVLHAPPSTGKKNGVKPPSVRVN
ncbi:unnamed protein product [Amoebophrya sp. A120]|nr:unnamed protein product [Amoebophrya sp. A120]|eukprot:GSA120T00016636001.1